MGKASRRKRERRRPWRVPLFEEHPYFHARVRVAGRDGFFVRGPPMPAEMGVQRLGYLTLILPDQPKEHRCYYLPYTVKHGADAPTRVIDREWQRREQEALAKAQATFALEGSE